ncbi:MAG: ferrous iron transport protein A [Acidobacteriales bacterium]|nr:ferrous iron transport protein A [Terriglobales bacterium]
MTEPNSVPLTEVLQGGTFVIDSVSDRDAHTLRELKASGIRPGAQLRVRKNTPAEGYSVSIGRSSRAVGLSREAAGDIRLVPSTK